MRTVLFGLLFMAVSAVFTAALAKESDAEPVKGEANSPYPLEYWALRSVIDQVQVSPDGKYVSLMKIPSKAGDPIIEIYESANLSKEPFRLNADPMEIIGYGWVDDATIVFGARQQVRDRIDGFNRGVYENKIALLDLKRKKIRELDQPGATISSLLPAKPGKILISVVEGQTEGTGGAEAFRPRSYWEYDLKRGSKQLVIRSKIDRGNIRFDGQGKPWLSSGFDIAKGDFVWYIRPEGTKSWEEIYRLSEDSFEDFNVYGKDPNKPGNILVGAQNGNDKRGLWSFNYTTQEFDELVYQRNDVDIWGVRRDSNDWQNPDKIVAVSYFKDRFHYEYFDEVEGALYDQLESVIPWAHQVSVSSRSRDGNTLVISNSGPRDPGTYYLIHQGKVETIGSRQPLIDSEKLADVKYIQYKSRDGVMIPGFVHVPKGEGPHPLVVMPHGGPFVSEVVIYDEWAQMLANNGYMVLQPQYRGSQNYGLGFYKTAFIDGGTGGHMMQDDKDDGALYLVEKGMADPDRIAMFGWSYGGYAALIAASRSPQIYQCVIAGAAVTDNNLQVNYYRFRLRGAQKLEQLGFWDDSISPIEEVDKVNVPMLMIHGSVDQRVPPEHAKRYLEALADGNKNHKYMWLEGADHFSNTLFYDHKIKLYNAMIDYLQNDCGPGGLQAATVN